MPRVKLSDGTVITMPDNPTPGDLDALQQAEKIAAGRGAPSFWDTLKQAAKPEIGDEVAAVAAGLGKGAGRVGLGAQHYAGKGIRAVGDLISPPQQTLSSLVTGQPELGAVSRAGQWLVDDAAQGRKNLEAETAPFRKESPVATGAGELGGEILATLPVGGLLAKAGGALLPSAVKSTPAVQKVLSAIRSSGTKLGTPAATTTAGKIADLGIRSAGGAITGGVTAGLVDPEQAKLGALIGGAFPLTTSAAGAVGRGIGKAIRSNPPSDEVVALAQRAKELGIDVPADRLVNSRPLNAAAASLNYVPFSGRAATEDRIQNQLNRALSRTFGQDSDNVTLALRTAKRELGRKFDDVLRGGTPVRADNQLLDELADIEVRAFNSLETGPFNVIKKQLNQILEKVKAGDVIDSDAAYNIKRTLDDISAGKTTQSSYARELRDSLIDALNRSIGPDEAQAFAKTRQQYGAMRTLEKIARNGADGDVSIGRLANLTNIRNPEIQELADIAAQFLKTRENPHGAMQRVAMASLGAAAAKFGGPPGWLLAGGMIGGGRAANTALNSNLARDLLLYGSSPAVDSTLSALLPLTSKAAPVISAR